jgi:hypothetical protein
MTVTFPIDFPSNIGIGSFKMGLRTAVGRLESPFSFAEQVIRYSGEIWEIEVGLPNMLREDAEYFNAFLLKLRGRWGTFLIGDPNAATPRGAWAGTPLVKGASQTGATLLIDGLTPSTTIKAGDNFQLGSGSTSRLHKVLNDTTANGSGEATLDIAPNIRTSPADNAALTIANPRGLFRLNDSIQPFSINSNSIYNISFKATESL